jgi:hypothetical protein
VHPPIYIAHFSRLLAEKERSLVCFVCLVFLVERNLPDELNKTNKPTK